jgi:hypothetical protein
MNWTFSIMSRPATAVRIAWGALIGAASTPPPISVPHATSPAAAATVKTNLCIIHSYPFGLCLLGTLGPENLSDIQDKY